MTEVERTELARVRTEYSRICAENSVYAKRIQTATAVLTLVSFCLILWRTFT